MIGQTISHYRVLEKIGGGGMGEVYRAHDEHLERDVALKVLPAGTLADESARKRFRKEALALSKLNHPSIATVHDFDTEEGVDFLVMELVPGQALKERLKDGALKEKDILGLGMQLADGLTAAHAQGIVHCDLKPGNLCITPEDRLKILDFGLAKLLAPTADPNVTRSLTESRAVAGTLPYMSPEQLQGDPPDARTDIYAAGAVLYEMATARRPFEQTLSTALVNDIIHKPPPSPGRLNPKLSPKLQDIILKCLEKDPENRYQSAKELLVDLRRVGTPSSVAPIAPPVRIRLGRWGTTLSVSAGAILILAALVRLNVGGWRDWRARQPGPAGAPNIRSLAVLPLANLSGDPEQDYLADGMTEELITELAKVGSLKVISRTSVMHYKGANKTLPQIARELNVDGVVEGSVQRSGERVRITAQLIRAATDEHLWAEEYERDSRDVLVMEEEIARDITKEVRVRLTPEENALLAGARPIDPQAHEAYLKGRFYWYKRTDKDLKKALEYFQQAIEKDPNYAAAYDGLADCYLELTEYGSLSTSEARPKAEAAARKALEIDPSLAEAHATLAGIRDLIDWDWVDAEQEYKRAIELNPNYATSHDWYSLYLAEMGRTAEAIAEGRRAQQLDPLSPRANSVVCWQLYFARRYDEAIEQARKTLELDADYMPAFWCSGAAYAEKADFKEAIAELQRAVTLSGGSTEIQAWLGYTYAVAGKRDQALAILEQLKNRSKHEYVAPNRFAEIYTGLGDKDQAFKWWSKARDERSDLIYLTVWPATDSLRSDPRYRELLRSMGLPF
jgi:TolB-like protein/tetratricopeptide (TPR) repeat protein